MLGLLLTLAVVAWVGTMLLRKARAQGVLLAAGFVLLACSVIFHTQPLLSPAKSTGWVFFDIFDVMRGQMSTRLAGLGLTIMSIGGFVRYMEVSGANRAMVECSAVVLKLVHSPILVIIVGHCIGQVLNLFIPSHTGLSMLLMLTLYPILVHAGLSRLTSCAVIATAKFTDLGPVSSNAILAAHTAGMDPVSYFIGYQLPAILPSVVIVGIAHCVVQPWFDRRDAAKVALSAPPPPQESRPTADTSKPAVIPPRIYAVLPVLPLALVVAFCPLFHTGINMDMITAILICMFITMVFEFIYRRNFRLVIDNVMTFFEGMGRQFIAVVSLVITAEIFGLGLMKIGGIDTLLSAAQSAGFGLGPMIVTVSVLMFLCAFIMGSGNASFFAFASLGPRIATFLHVPAVQILMPMELSTGMGRCFSPIAPPIVAVATIAEVSPMAVVRRCAIPVGAAFITYLINSFILYVL